MSAETTSRPGIAATGGQPSPAAPTAASAGTAPVDVIGLPLDWHGRFTVISPWRDTVWPLTGTLCPPLAAAVVWFSGQDPTRMVATGTGLAVVVCGIDRWVTRHNRWRASARAERTARKDRR